MARTKDKTPWERDRRASLKFWCALKAHQREKRLERENAKASIELLEAIEIANQGILIQSLGDYYGALSKDFKDSKEFSLPSEKTKWKFLGCETFAEIVDTYNEEQIALTDDPTLPSPMSDALKLAFKYTKPRYQSLDQIISFLGGYAMRNKVVHGVKQWFDDGKHEIMEETSRPVSAYKMLQCNFVY
jgi:hypothetical protein